MPRVPHRPWTYEPHAQGRSLSYTFFSFGLGLPCVLILVLSTASTFALVSLLPSFGCLQFPSALLLFSSAFLSVNVSFCRFSLGPSFSDPSLNTRCGGIYSLISLFRIAASSTPLSWSFGMNFVIIRRPLCGLHIRLSRVG